MKLKSNNFIRDIGKVMSGVVIINILSIVSLPIITRLFDPAIFGAYQSLIALVLILSSVSTLKYELAIVLPKRRKSAENILKLAFYILVCFTGLLFLIFFTFNDLIANKFKLPDYVAFILPLLVFVTAIKPVFQYWYTRNQRYGLISKNNVTEQLINRTGMIAAGYVYPSISLLIVSYFLSKIFTTVNLIKSSKVKLLNVKKKLLYLYFVQHKKFLIYITPATLANVLSTQAPVLLVGYFFGPIIAGYFAVVQRLINMPLTLAQQSLGQVYFERAAKEINDKGHAASITLKMISVLSIVALVATAGLYFVGEPVLVKYLGQEWSEASSYLVILLPVFFFRLIKAPINYWILVNKQEITLTMNCFQLVLMAISFAFFHNEPTQSVLTFSLFMAFFYFVNIICVVVHSLKTRLSREQQ